MLYGIQTGFGGSPQVPVAELLARPAPTLLSPQNQRPKSSNFLQVPDIESRPKSVPSSPMVKRAFSRLGTITAGWGRSIRSKQHSSQLNAEDKKKWASSQDCSGEILKSSIESAQITISSLSLQTDKDNKDRASKDKAASAVPRKCAKTIRSHFKMLSIFIILSFLSLKVCRFVPMRRKWIDKS
jgi:RAP1 GTPase activating protein 1